MASDYDDAGCTWGVRSLSDGLCGISVTGCIGAHHILQRPKRLPRQRPYLKPHRPLLCETGVTMQEGLTTQTKEERSGLSFLFSPTKIEVLVWGFLTYVAFMVSAQGLRYSPYAPVALTATILLFLYPIVHRLIFGFLPLEHIRRRRAGEPGSPSAPLVNVEFSLAVPSSNNTATRVQISPNAPADEVLVTLLGASRALAQRIFGRAGVYLLVGVLIAFAGLVFFGLQSVPVAAGATKMDVWDPMWIVVLVPRAGILFFIEFIAFFFLRQYRSAMDEFRYFEAIQRCREDTFALVRLMKEQDGKVDLVRLLENRGFYSTAGKLASGETTEMLESRKLTKDEMDLFVKMIDAVSDRKVS
jgi:hypothetical protein